jgi:hypothetical protein
VRAALRVVAHLAAEVPLGIVVALQISRGWLPTSDDAVIAWRTWSVLSGPLPLDGQFTQISATGGRAAFDLGPLQYYLLAVPERIDPLHGVLWGSALLAAILVALAIEAAWSVAGPFAAAAVATGAAVMTATLAESTVNLAWNPSLGVYALGAALVMAAAAGSGRLGWLPVSVGAASLAVECHVAYAAAAAAALAVGTVFGLANCERSRHRLRPVLAALAVGTACFAAPLVQELTGHPGNWSVLARSLGRPGRTVGLDLGLRGLAAATHLPPSWAHRVPVTGTSILVDRLLRDVYGGSVAWAVTALAACGAIAVAATLTRHRLLASMASISLLSGFAAAWTLGSVPLSQAGYLAYYLYFVLWPVGMLVLATLACGAGLALNVLAGRALGEARRHARAGGRAGVAALAAATVALAAGGIALGAADTAYGSSGLFLLGWQPVRLVAEAAPRALALAEAHGLGSSAPGRRTLTVITTGDYPVITDAVSQGVAYLLATHGLPARLRGSALRPLGAGYGARAGAPAVVVHLSFPGGNPRAAVSWRP